MTFWQKLDAFKFRGEAGPTNCFSSFMIVLLGLISQKNECQQSGGRVLCFQQSCLEIKLHFHTITNVYRAHSFKNLNESTQTTMFLFCSSNGNLILGKKHLMTHAQKGDAFGCACAYMALSKTVLANKHCWEKA